MVDGAEATALEVRALLGEAPRVPSTPRALRFLVTDAPEQMAMLAPRFLGQEVPADSVELVDVLMGPAP